MIISLGYRVHSLTATQFRRWATERLKEYLIKGFTMNDEKLKNLGGGDYWHELLERIRDIRSSEKVMYRQVLDLYAKEGNEFKVPADTVLYAVGSIPNSDVVEEIQEWTEWESFRAIGDCTGASIVKKAIHQGYYAAMDIL